MGVVKLGKANALISAALVLLVLSISFTTAAELSYDANGNLIDDGRLKFEYDGFNRLARIADQDGNTIESYLYDESGQRIYKESYDDEGQKTVYHYPGGGFVRIFYPNGSVTDEKYIYHQNQILAKISDGKKYFFHNGHLGSAQAITDEGGNLVERIDFLPFGAGTADEARYFTGKELDTSGLHYFGARYYDSGLRLFTQPDTLIQDVYDPQSLNRYAYSRNNPVKYVDPDGHFFDIIADAAFIVWDVVDIIYDPINAWNYAALGADVVGAAVPFLTGAGRALKAGSSIYKGADKAADVARAADKALDAGRVADRSIDTAKASSKSLSAANKADRGKDFVNAIEKPTNANRWSVWDRRVKSADVNSGAYNLGKINTRKGFSGSDIKISKGKAIITYGDIMPRGISGDIHETILPSYDRYGNIYKFNIHGTLQRGAKSNNILAYSETLPNNFDYEKHLKYKR